MLWPSRTVITNMRIRQTVLILFRRWFGSPAIKHWHEDGFMAEAWDRRGNRVMIQQINNDQHAGWALPT